MNGESKLPPPVAYRSPPGSHRGTDTFWRPAAYALAMARDTGGDGAEPTGQFAFPVDLVIVVALAGALVATALDLAAVGAPWVLVVAVLAVFLPGYALVAALFPRRPFAPGESPGRLGERARRLGGFERTVLSAGTGALVTPLLGIAVHFSPYPLATGPVVAAVSGFAGLGAVVATARRYRLPRAERYAPARRWVRAVEGGLYAERRLAGVDVVTVAVAVGVLVALGGVVTVVDTAESGERFSELYLLNETESGQFQAGPYPDQVAAGSPYTVFVGVENREGRRTTYTLVTKLQRVAEDDDQTRVVEQEVFQPVTVTAGSGQVERFEHSVTPTLTGDPLRLSYLLYRGEPPEEPTTTSAYRRVHVWLNVTSGRSAGAPSSRLSAGGSTGGF